MEKEYTIPRIYNENEHVTEFEKTDESGCKIYSSMIVETYMYVLKDGYHRISLIIKRENLDWTANIWYAFTDIIERAAPSLIKYINKCVESVNLEIEETKDILCTKDNTFGIKVREIGEENNYQYGRFDNQYSIAGIRIKRIS